MKKLLAVLVASLVTLPLAAQFSLKESFAKGLPKTQSIAHVAGGTGRPGQCLAYTDGSPSDICVAPDGNGYYVASNLALQGKARYYGSNGMSIGVGPDPGDQIYLGDPQRNGGLVVGNGGAYLRGKLALIAQNGLSSGYPVISDTGLAFYRSTRDETTSDKGSTSVALAIRFASIANVDPATKGSYVVLCVPKVANEVVTVAPEDMYPDHFVARSKSGNAVTFSYYIFALGDGFTPPRAFQADPNVASTPAAIEGKSDLLKELQNQ